MIFADTSFWNALRDRNHERAAELVGEILGKRWPIVITEFVLAEAHAYFARSVPLRKRILRDLLENPVVQSEPIEAQDRAQAQEYLRSSDDKNWSCCDSLSFAVIERLRIEAAARFDRHFPQAGSFEGFG